MTTTEGAPVVDAATVAGSAWQDRLRVHPTGTAPPPGVVAPAGLGPSIERGVGRLWALFTPDAHEGPAALVAPSRFAAAMRRLVDGLLTAAAPSAATVAIQVDPSSTLWPSLYPEAHGLEPAAPEPPLVRPAPQLLVIVGCGRSGTTWLERLLMAHPAAGGAEATESWTFAQCRWLWPEVTDGGGLAEGLTPDGLARLLRGFLDELFAATLERHRPEATLMVEKTPVHSLLLDQIGCVYPDAHYLHVVRDGRDVARSASQVPFFECPTPADGARLWARVVTAVRAAAPDLARYREVRYEALVDDPASVVGQIWDWVGLPPRAEAGQELARRAGERVSTHAGTAQAVGAGSWRGLRSSELAAIHAEAGELLVAEGYASAGELRRARVHPAYWRQRRLHRRR